MKPLECIGLGHTAKITVPNPEGIYLSNDTIYGFQIGTTNPSILNASTLWSLDFASEAAIPVESPTLRSFDAATTFMRLSSYSVIESSKHVAHTGTPMSIQFTPSVFVPSVQFGAFGGRRLQNYPPNADEGYLVLNAPGGFAFSMVNIDEGLVDGYTACSRTRLEVVGRDPADTSGIFVEGKDMTCTVEGLNTTRIRFQGEKALMPGITYELNFYVNNPVDPQPAQPWTFYSFKKKIDFRVKEFNQIVALDMFVFPGYSTNPTFSRLSVDNLSKEFNGGFQVRQVRVSMLFLEHVLDDDMLILSAPVGFNLVTRTITGQYVCNNFRYPSVLLPLLNTPHPTCTCDYPGPQCKLVFHMKEGQPNGISLLKGALLEFDIGGVNPIASPVTVENNWEASHVRAGRVQSSRDVPGWLLYAQPQNITVEISGMFMRANSYSELSITFVATAWASALQLTITEPAGFDFNQCLAAAPLDRDERTSGNKLVVVGGNFQIGVRTWVVLKKTRLGNPGGETKINFLLFADANLQYPVGRRFNFTGGFRLPGAVMVRDQQLLSEAVVAHFERNQLDTMQPYLPARAGLPTRVELTFQITMPVGLGHRLELRSKAKDTGTGVKDTPYFMIFDPEHLVTLDRCTYGPSSASPHTSCEQLNTINITGVDLIMEEKQVVALSMSLAHAAYATAGGMILPPPILPVLEARQIYRLRAWCLPNTNTVNWLIETHDGGVLPTNTNDAITEAIRTVAPMGIDLWAIRTPPSSVIDTTVTIAPGPFGADIEQVRICMPKGFTHGTSVGPYSVTSFGSFLKTGRPIAKLKLLPSQRKVISQSGTVLKPRVMSPSATGTDPRWFIMMYRWAADVIVKDDSTAEMVAWGVYEGWSLDPLNVSITYANIEFFLGNVAVYFTVPKLASGKFAVISAPAGFILGCPKSQGGRQAPSCSWLPPTVNLTLAGQGVEEGASKVYSFVVPMKTPEFPPDVNNWDVRIYDHINNVVDGIVGIQKDTFVTGMYLDDPFIQWENQPQRGEFSNVVVSVTLNRRVWRLRGMLVSMPEGYRHDIQHPNQFKALTKTFPIAIDVPWRNYENLRWVRILIAKAEEAIDFVPSGTYKFQFPVMLPVYKPLATEWYFSLCRNYDCETVSPPDPGVIVSFPMPQPAVLLPVKIFRPTAVTGSATRSAPCSVASALMMAALLFAALLF